MKILKWLAFPFIWICNDIKAEMKKRENETEDDCIDFQW